MKPTQRLCSKCEAEPAKPGQRYGKKCHAAYMRQWRLDRSAGRNWHKITDDEWALIESRRRSANAVL